MAGEWQFRFQQEIIRKTSSYYAGNKLWEQAMAIQAIYVNVTGTYRLLFPLQGVRSEGTKLLPCLDHDTPPSPSVLSQHSPLSNHPYLTDISPHTILPFQAWSPSFPSTLLPQPICSLCHSLFPHLHHVQPISAVISPICQSNSSAHQSPPSGHPSSFYPPSCNPPGPVVLANL